MSYNLFKRYLIQSWSLKKCYNGQALITLIFISVIGITVATGAAMLVYINAHSGLKLEQGVKAYQIAQSGADNAVLRLLRDPSYTGESGMIVGEGFVDIEIENNSGDYIITTIGRLGNFVRKVQINAHYDEAYMLVIDSRKEVF